MAGYVKIWTQLTDDPKFLGLSMNERSGLFQLIVAAKKQRDNGTIWVRAMSALAQDWACEVRTARKVLVKLQETGWCDYEKHPDNTVEVTLHNYKEFQEIDTKEMVRRNRTSPVKKQPLRPDQTKAKQTKLTSDKSDHKKVIEYFCKKHEECLGIKYEIQGAKDGAIVKKLTRYPLADIRARIDTLFNSPKKFYNNNRTLGILSACWNQLSQEGGGRGTVTEGDREYEPVGRITENRNNTENPKT